MKPGILKGQNAWHSSTDQHSKEKRRNVDTMREGARAADKKRKPCRISFKTKKRHIDWAQMHKTLKRG